ncbi:MAG: type II toxin-antitoxin system YafQ family toxin [Ruminococcus sp.]|jgi:mRNA interferase YafQ|nr:type II toxin-antitoxin system YafQ family toxin [Ruminococcus sp.]
MKYTIVPTAQFKRDRKKAVKRGLDIPLLKWVIDELAEGRKLPPKHKDHKMTGDRHGYRDCHITPDWVLIYRYEENELILSLVEMNSHSNLF